MLIIYVFGIPTFGFWLLFKRRRYFLKVLREKPGMWSWDYIRRKNKAELSYRRLSHIFQGYVDEFYLYGPTRGDLRLCFLLRDWAFAGIID